MGTNLTILVAEDSPDDALFFRLACNAAKQDHRLHFVADGKEAIDYLQGKGQFADRQSYPSPDLVVLDLKMPRVNGFQVLEWIRSRPELKGLNVVVLTGSIYPSDPPRAAELGAKGFFVKSCWGEEFIQTIRDICRNFLRPSVVSHPA